MYSISFLVFFMLKAVFRWRFWVGPVAVMVGENWGVVWEFVGDVVVFGCCLVLLLFDGLFYRSRLNFLCTCTELLLFLLTLIF